MLMISRRKGERIVIGDDIEIVVAEIRGGTVRIGVRAGPQQSVFRGELYDAIHAANQAAATSTFEALDVVSAEPRRECRTRARATAFAPSSAMSCEAEP